MNEELLVKNLLKIDEPEDDLRFECQLDTAIGAAPQFLSKLVKT